MDIKIPLSFVLQADLNFNKQYNLIACLSDCVIKIRNCPISMLYSNTLKVMHFGKVYFAPLSVSLGDCGCIYDIQMSYE